MATGQLTAFELREEDLPDLARGCAVLGTGGGGSVGTGLLAARRAIRECGPVPVRPLGAFADEETVAPLSGIGAPTVGHEMIASEHEALALQAAVEELLGRKIAAVMSSEIGGSNGVAPVAWAARMGVPLVDADGMGRAFPEVQMVSLYVAGVPYNYIVMSDVVGNVSVLRPLDGLWAERQARALAVASGSHSLMADYIITAAQARGAVIEGSVSHALSIGRAMRLSTDPVEALQQELGAHKLIEGKIVDIERRTGGGFVRGSVIVDGVGGHRGELLRIEVQNENLIALRDGVVLASVPDLITVVDTATGVAISTETLRYGQRATVLAWPCDPLWRTPRGLEVAGPRAFGYDIDYRPIEELRSATV